ncbi:MAG: FTR1 family protein [Chloroflexi bacterium]|nr:FTR1 family protein [Chloroflexota bacterium]
MAQSLLITLREGLEAALIVGIVLAVLVQLGRRDLQRPVWLGVGLGVAASLGVGGVLFGVGFALEGAAEEAFEGLAMLVAAGVLTWMIVWMKGRARFLRKEIEAQVRQTIAGGSALALTGLAFFAVGREGLETALFLFAAVKTSTALETLTGGLAGLALAVALGVVIYQGSRALNLRAFFTVTGLLLILFAAGLFARGIHEFQELGLVPSIIAPVWDTNGVLNEKEGVGALLKGLLGYNGNPSLVEVIGYTAYLVVGLAYFYSWVSLQRLLRRGAAA